jgi:hypothetical protein
MGSSAALLGQVESFADMSAGACQLGSLMLQCQLQDYCCIACCDAPENDCSLFAGHTS